MGWDQRKTNGLLGMEGQDIIQNVKTDWGGERRSNFGRLK